MYSIYKRILADSIITKIMGYYRRNFKIQYINEIPCICDHTPRAIDAFSSGLIYSSFTRMLNLFCIGAQQNGTNGKIDIIFEDTKVSLTMELNMIRSNWNKINGTWNVWCLSDLSLYENIEGKLDRLLLQLLIDPLAFISRMRGEIYKASLGVRTVFSRVEDNINSMAYGQVFKYFLVRQLGCGDMVVDIVWLIIDIWVDLEVLALENNVE